MGGDLPVKLQANCSSIKPFTEQIESMSEASDSFSTTVGDMQIGSTTALSSDNPVGIMVSRQGIKKQVDVLFDLYEEGYPDPEDLSKFPEFFREFEEEAGVSDVLWKCTKCGDLYSVKGIRPPESCDCSKNSGFVMEGEYPTVEKDLGPVHLSAYEKDDEPVFEFRNKGDDSGEIFYKVNDKFGAIADAFDEILRKYEESDQEESEVDLDDIEAGLSSEELSGQDAVRRVIEDLSGEGSAEIDEVLRVAEEEYQIEEEKTEDIIEKLKREGELFEPKQDYVQRI